MTAPQAEGADRILGVTRSPITAGGAASGLAILLLLGLLLRLTIAYVLLPGSGFESDIGTFTAWAFRLGETGPGTFYATAGFADYPPGYLYVLWLVGAIGHTLAPMAGGDAGAAISALIKIPPILADIAVGFVLYRLVRSWSGPDARGHRLGMAAAALYVFNPVTWYDSAIWGQTDAMGALVILLTIAALIRGNAEGASALAVLAALVKPQFGVVALPVVGIVLLRRHLLDQHSVPRNRVLAPAAIRGWLERERGAWRLVSSAVVALVVLLLVITPFSLDVPGYIDQMRETAGGYPWLSVNAYNPWALVGSEGRAPLAFGGGWSPDTVPLLGPLPGVLVGGGLLLLGFAAGALRLAWLADRRSIIVVTIFLALAFFVLPTRVHERYMFPIFGLLPLVAVVDRRWLIATVVLSGAAFINLHGVLTTELYATPNIERLPLGALFRQPLGIVTSAVLHIAGFAFICWRMRPAAAREPDAMAGSAVGPGRPDTTSPRGTGFVVVDDDGDAQRVPERPSATRAALRRWLSPVLHRPSVRRDRSALLVREPGGRLGRRDLALIAAVFVSTLLLRTYRLEVPYSMHFDEVYHARTAVEFLQHWRYGMPHSIYEFTHPHLAKYAMAAGIVAMGNNRVVDSRDLDADVRDAAIEPRWSLPTEPGARRGERLYVVTPNEMRAYDLAARESALPSVSGAFTAVAVDDESHALFLGDAAGNIVRLTTDAYDAVRTGEAARDATHVIAPSAFAALSGLDGELVSLTVSGGQLIARSSGGTLMSLDAGLGGETGRTTLATPSEVVEATTRRQVVVDPAVADAAAVADRLAELLGEDAVRLESVIAAAAAPVPVAGYVGEAADDVQAAIDAGELDGVTVTDGPGVAVGTADGVALLDAVTLAQLAEFDTPQPVSGLALIESGPDQPTLYAASGDTLQTVRLPSDQPAALGSSVEMPNTVDDVVWNPATTMVHALGASPDGAARTVYVVEPRSNSVFADARLAFDPRSLVVDAQPAYPAEDRDDLLALSADGQLATIDAGNNQFAYRFPGVLLGALMAVCMYLLARFLFQRRSVAVIASLLVLADGMFFANARIAMNDPYVSFFIVAALTAFVPLWLGRWRSRTALAVGLVAVGLLLGLALASKWVGAYAIGGVGLLILARSALGRLIAFVALVAMTGVLGFIAIAPNPALPDAQQNYLFLALMVALCVITAVILARRPIRATPEELRLAFIGPVVAGAAVLLVALLRPGETGIDVRIAGLGLGLVGAGVLVAAVGWLAGRRGRGPWAAQPIPVRADGEPAAPPPPRGWLRPGSGFLGLPWLLSLAAITLIPLAVYTASYVPWIELGNRWTEGVPAGHTGQTFLDLQRSMYDYHNNLRATHAAASPWWAWPLDLKPVWFEQNDYADRTTAVIYDTGNLVIFWLAIPAVAWLAWQAWRRRSLPLAFIVISIACMWLPWARIDRATFQYHIFTALPFSFLALAYFLAELWHGPSPRTWLLARAAAALAILGPPLLWLLRQPLCGIARTEQVNSGTEVCAALSRDLVLTDLQMAGLALAVAGLAAAGALVYAATRAERVPGSTGSPRFLLLPLTFSVALFGVVIAIVGAALGGNTFLQLRVSAEEPAVIALVLLAVPAHFVLRATDPRRFVLGALAAAAIWFVAFYPNIASLPVPTPLSQIHLGLLPTWNWGFQFGVNMDEPNGAGLDPYGVGLLTLAVVVLCAAAAYAARNWDAARDEETTVSVLPEAG